MQVFVPSDNIIEIVHVLDTRRLRKQILECIGILSIIYKLPKADGSPRKGHLNHPAVMQWKFWPGFLASYNLACLEEMENRGYFSNVMRSQSEIFETHAVPPVWWGDNRIHSSHRSRLIQKDFDYYSKFNWLELDMDPQPYWWAIPVNESEYVLERRGKSK